MPKLKDTGSMEIIISIKYFNYLTRIYESNEMCSYTLYMKTTSSYGFYFRLFLSQIFIWKELTLLDHIDLSHRYHIQTPARCYSVSLRFFYLLGASRTWISLTSIPENAPKIDQSILSTPKNRNGFRRNLDVLHYVFGKHKVYDQENRVWTRLQFINLLKRHEIKENAHMLNWASF